MVETDFACTGLGTLIGVTICNLCLDRIYFKLRDANRGVGLPEHRLPLAMVGILTLPPAVALYGSCAQYRLPLVLLIASVVWIRASMMLAYLPLMAYVVDACVLYSASALTGVVVMRCLAGAFLPLVVALLAEHLGYVRAFGMLGALTLALGLIPVLIFKHGARWRQRCEYTRTEPE